MFGSNLAGQHMGGAARVAHERFGAVYGQGVGLQGQSYAIPTMHGGPEAIKPYVDQFIRDAREWDQTTFYVTRIGCGIAGYTDEQIAPLFAEAVGMYNVVLPKSFVDVLRGPKYTRSYHGDSLRHYSSYDMAVDYFLMLNRFNSYGLHDKEVALDDWRNMVLSWRPMFTAEIDKLLSDIYPGDWAAPCMATVEEFCAKADLQIRRAAPYSIPALRMIIGCFGELGELMLKCFTWRTSHSDRHGLDFPFFYCLANLATGRKLDSGNNERYDDIEAVLPALEAAIDREWDSLFVDGKMCEQRVVGLFSRPDLWQPWHEGCKHGMGIYHCFKYILQDECELPDGKYGCDRNFLNFYPRHDLSLPVFTAKSGLVHFPNTTLEQAFISAQQSR